MNHSIPNPQQYFRRNASASLFRNNGDYDYYTRDLHSPSSRLLPPRQPVTTHNTSSCPLAATNVPVYESSAVPPRSRSEQNDINHELLSQLNAPNQSSQPAYALPPLVFPQPVYPIPSYSNFHPHHLSNSPDLNERASAPNPDHGWNTTSPLAIHAGKSSESSLILASPSTKVPSQQQYRTAHAMDQSAPLSSHRFPATHLPNSQSCTPNSHSAESLGGLSVSAVSNVDEPEVLPFSPQSVKEETITPEADDEAAEIYKGKDSPSSMRSRRGPKMHVCQHCLKQFPRPSGLATHMNMHNNVKPYPCPFPNCDKSFSVRSNATRHLRTHGPDAAPYLLPKRSFEAGTYESIRFENPVVFDPQIAEQFVELYQEQP